MMIPENGELVTAISIHVRPGKDGMQIEVRHEVRQGWPMVVKLLLEALRVAIREEQANAGQAPLIMPVPLT